MGEPPRSAWALERIDPAVVVRDHASDLFSRPLKLCGQFQGTDVAHSRSCTPVLRKASSRVCGLTKRSASVRVASRLRWVCCCVPLEALPQVILARAHGNLVRGHLGDLVILHPVLVAQDLDGLFAADPIRSSQRERQWPSPARAASSRPRAQRWPPTPTPHAMAVLPQLDGRAQERFECVVVLHCTPRADGLLGALVMEPSGITTSG